MGTYKERTFKYSWNNDVARMVKYIEIQFKTTLKFVAVCFLHMVNVHWQVRKVVVVDNCS